MKNRLNEVLGRLTAKYEQKHAAELPLGGFEKIAEHLRSRSTSEPSYDVLRDALHHSFNAPVSTPLDPRGSTNFHKLAQLVRVAAHTEVQTAYDDAANTLYAARALTLLRDRIRR